MLAYRDLPQGSTPGTGLRPRPLSARFVEASRARITANLLCEPTGRYLGAESHESDLRGLLVLQDQAALAIANEIRIKLTPEEHARLTGPRVVSPEALEQVPG